MAERLENLEQVSLNSSRFKFEDYSYPKSLGDWVKDKVFERLDARRLIDCLTHEIFFYEKSYGVDKIILYKNESDYKNEKNAVLISKPDVTVYY